MSSGLKTWSVRPSLTSVWRSARLNRRRICSVVGRLHGRCLGVDGQLHDLRSRCMARRSSRSMSACTSEREEVQGEQRLDAPLVLQEHGRDLVHGLDLLEALLDGGLALVGVEHLGRREAAVVGEQRVVNVIRDSVGTIGTPTEFFTRLSDAGIKVLEFNPINPLTAKAGWDVNQRDHRKLLIVDGRIAFLGGIYISSVYSGGSFSQRSQSAALRKAALARHRPADSKGRWSVSCKSFSSKPGKNRKANRLRRATTFRRPNAKAGRWCAPSAAHRRTLQPDLRYADLQNRANAQTEIWLTNAYFVPDPQLLAALKEAVARGVDVKLVLPSKTDSWLVFHAGCAYYTELLTAGVKLYERRNALLHVKTAVIDGVWSTVGSTNLDWRSFLHNQEVNVVVLGTGFGGRMRAAFLADLAES